MSSSDQYMQTYAECRLIQSELQTSYEEIDLARKCLDLDKVPGLTPEIAANIKKLKLSFNYGISLQRVCKFRALSELILHSCDLTVLPEEVTLLQNLEALDLSGNRRMASLPPSLSRLQRLRVLNLSCCFLSDLPDEMANLKNLETLDLSNNRNLLNLPISVIRLPSLCVLNLSYCGLSQLPNQMSELAKLVELNVRNNPLAITAALILPQHLKKLTACCCKFEKSWSSGFECVTTLEELNISDNAEIVMLPSSICHATSLRRLTVSYCGLTKLPDELGLFHLLEVFDCSYNRSLTNLPHTVTGIKALTCLNFCECNMSSLPEDIELLESLEELDFSGNAGICKLPATIWKLSKLRKLSAGCCRLTELPPDISCRTNVHLCPQLEYLDVRSNRLKTFPLCALHMPKLKVLILSNSKDQIGRGNIIQRLPPEIVSTCLATLDLYGNPMVQPPSVVCQQGIDAVKAYMKVENTVLLQGSAVSILECTSTDSCNYTSTVFQTSCCYRVTLDSHPVVHNDLTALSDHPEVVSEFLSETGINIITCKFSDASLESLIRGDDQTLLRQSLHRWLLTVLSRFSTGRVLVVGVLTGKTDDFDMGVVKDGISHLIKNFFTSVQHDAEKFEGSFKPFECWTQNVLIRRSADVHVLVLRHEMNTIIDLSAIIKEGFQRDLVIQELVVPAWWQKVVGDICDSLKRNTCTFPFMTLDLVQSIVNMPSSSEKKDDCHYPSLVAILQCLCNSAQIFWLRDNPELSKYVLGPPCGLLEAVRTVLKYDDGTDMTKNMSCEAQLRDLQNARLSKQLLKHILSLDDGASDAAFNFMKAVGVICELQTYATQSEPAGLLVSRLPEQPPSDVLLKSCAFLPSVTIIIQFFSSVIPYAFFENCLFAGLARVSAPEEKLWLWRRGMSFTQSGVTVTLSLLSNSVSVSARGETCSSDIWSVFYPLLQSVAASIRTKWKGLQPVYMLVCPHCMYAGKADKALPSEHCGSRVLLDLDIVRMQPTTVDHWTCSSCNNYVPSYLSFPRLPGCLLAEDEAQLLLLKSNIDDKESRAADEDVAQRGMSSMPWEQQSVPTSHIVCTHESVDGVQLSCLHTCCRSCASVASAAAGQPCTLYCRVCKVDTKVWQRSLDGATHVDISSCPEHRGNFEKYCADCNRRRCTEYLDNCQMAAKSKSGAAYSISTTSDMNSTLQRYLDYIGNELAIRRHYVNEVRSARNNAIAILSDKKRRIIKSIDDKYCDRKKKLDESYEQLEKLAATVQCSAERLEKTLRHALDYAKRFLVTSEAMSDLDQRNNQEIILSRLFSLESELFRTGPAPPAANLVGVSDLPDYLDHIVEKLLATPEAPLLPSPPDSGYASSLDTTIQRASQPVQLDEHSDDEGFSTCSAPTAVDDTISVLSGMNDAEIAEEAILKCDDIHSFDLSRNPGIQLSQSYRRFTNARTLLLNDCALQWIPNEIRELVELEELQLDKNDFSAGLNSAVGELVRLKKLYVRASGLTALPNSIGDLVQLEELLLGSNNFSNGLPHAIGRLMRLKKLDLSSCSLKSVPDRLGDLKQLEELDLDFNDFSNGLPPAIGHLIHLKKLCLRGCELNCLPDCIGDLEKLEELDLGLSDFSNGLSPAIGRLIRLKKLCLRRCKLKGLPDCIQELTQLEELNLNFNDFSNGHFNAIARLVRLKILFLSSCELRYLPDCISDLEELVLLNVSCNVLRSYPFCTLKMKKLRTLDISNRSSVEEKNCIKQLPVQLAYTNLQELKLDGNPITEPPVEIWTLGLDAIKSFMRAAIPGGTLMLSDTLNIIGDSGAGKTSLAQSLSARSPRPTAEADRTRVLQQIRMTVDDISGQSVIINDFGGHEIYHSAIPIFLPANGLVILVFDLTTENPEETVKKWLLTTIAKSKEIRVIIVGTHSDKVVDGQRLSLELRMLTFILTVLRNAAEEVIDRINNLAAGSNENSTKLHHLREKLHNALAGFWQIVTDKLEGLKNRSSQLPDTTHNLLALDQCLVRLKDFVMRNGAGQRKLNNGVHFVTFNCLVADQGLTELCDTVSSLFRSRDIMPVRWFRVMKDILSQSLDLPYIKMEQVLEISNVHFTKDDDSNALHTILHYLASTSQIIWLEQHPVLHKLIFHSPSTIIDVCKTILRDTALPDTILNYEDAMEEYKQGYLSAPLLRKLLSSCSGGVDLDMKSVRDCKHLPLAEVVTEFLLNFNLISHVATQNRGEKFIIPCNLSSDVPRILEELEQIGNIYRNRVIVRLTFIGSLIPLSLFETSLASMLSAAFELAEHNVCPEVWRDGVVISHNGVTLVVVRRGSIITFTAFSSPIDPNPWTLLHPVLVRLKENVAASWQGSPPYWTVVCPICVHHPQRSKDSPPQTGAINASLEILTEIRESRMKPQCQTCKRWIPRTLCFPTGTAGSFTKNQTEIEEFFRNTDLERCGVAPDEPPFKRSKLRHSGGSSNATTAHHQLAANFRRAYNNIKSKLIEQEVNHIAGELYSRPIQCVLQAELEEIQAAQGATQKATKLLNILGKKSLQVIQAFEEILRKIHRTDLADLLASSTNADC